MKKKSGDKVAIKSNLEAGMDIMFGFTVGMEEFVGKECTIKDVYDLDMFNKPFEDSKIVYTLEEDENEHSWNIEMFEMFH